MKRQPLAGEKEFTASVILLTQQEPVRTLLLHHKKYDLWIPPGGHIEKLENPLEAAVREVQEETGIDISPWLFPGRKVDTYAFHVPVPDFILEEKIPPFGEQPEHFHVDLHYVVQLPSAFEARVEPDKSHDIGWFTWAEVQQLKTFDNSQIMFEKLLRGERFA